MNLYKVEHRVGIKRSVDDIYAIVQDINSWPSWSPIHKASNGELKFAGKVSLDETYEGLGRWELSGHIEDYSPLSHIHVRIPRPFWEGSLIRYFEFEILSNEGCSFCVGAAFGGFLSIREGRRHAKALKNGFEAMGNALKTLSEARL
jgi:hypothetical protein